MQVHTSLVINITSPSILQPVDTSKYHTYYPLDVNSVCKQTPLTLPWYNFPAIRWFWTDKAPNLQ